MSDKIFLGQKANDLNSSTPSPPFTKVIIIAGQDSDGVPITYEAGDDFDGGKVLEIQNPWGTQEMAEDILERVSWYVYQPFEASDVIAPDTLDLGDVVMFEDINGPVITQDIEFDSLSACDLAAPFSDETKNEFGEQTSNKPATISDLERRINSVRTSFRVDIDSITASVEDISAGMGQTVRIAADGITITNAQGDTLEIDGGQLKASSVTATQIQTSSISVASLRDGSSYATRSYLQTYIDEASITAERLRGHDIRVVVLDEDDEEVEIGGFSNTITDTGAGMAIYTLNGAGGITIIAGGGNLFLTSYYDTRILMDQDAVKIGPTIWATDGTVIHSSDRNLKKDIEYDISRYRDFLLSLKPCRFKFIDGKSDRYHIGLIAQDMEESMIQNGLDSKDFSGWCKMALRDENEQPTGEYTYGIRYESLIPLNTMLIQELVKRVEALENGQNS